MAIGAVVIVEVAVAAGTAVQCSGGCCLCWHKVAMVIAVEIAVGIALIVAVAGQPLPFERAE